MNCHEIVKFKSGMIKKLETLGLDVDCTTCTKSTDVVVKLS
jgi:hypothetical protein